MDAELVGQGIYRIAEFAAILGVGEDEVVALVVAGVVEPVGDQPPRWIFPDVALLRARRTLRLGRELAIEPHAAALVADLLDEIGRLRRKLEAVSAGRGEVDVDCEE